VATLVEGRFIEFSIIGRSCSRSIKKFFRLSQMSMELQIAHQQSKKLLFDLLILDTMGCLKKVSI